jgi:hypothetical protein
MKDSKGVEIVKARFLTTLSVLAALALVVGAGMRWY